MKMARQENPKKMNGNDDSTTSMTRLYLRHYLLNVITFVLSQLYYDAIIFIIIILCLVSVIPAIS